MFDSAPFSSRCLASCYIALLIAVSSGVHPYSVTLIDGRARVEQQLRRFKVAFSRREDDGQTPPPLSPQPGHDDIVSSSGSGSWGAACAPHRRALSTAVAPRPVAPAALADPLLAPPVPVGRALRSVVKE